MDVLDETSSTSQDGGDTHSVKKKPLAIKETWTHHHEKIFIEWADKAMCYRWLHNSAHMDYKSYNTWFTIPVICISTITGTANFAQDRFADNMKAMVQVAIGTCNIIAAILTTIQQFLKISELNEGHRVSSLLWGKFYRDIKVEMAKSPHERNPPSVLLKHCKNEFDRLMEISPIIPPFTINNFKETFSGKKRSKSWNAKCKMLCCNGYVCCEQEDKVEYMIQEVGENDTPGSTSSNSTIRKKKLTEKEKIEKMKQAFDKIHKPEICDELVSTEESRFKFDPAVDVVEDNSINFQMIETTKKRDLLASSFIRDFSNLNGREPTFIEFQDGIIKSIPKEHVTIELYNTGVKELKGPTMI